MDAAKPVLLVLAHWWALNQAEPVGALELQVRPPPLSVCGVEQHWSAAVDIPPVLTVNLFSRAVVPDALWSVG